MIVPSHPNKTYVHPNKTFLDSAGPLINLPYVVKNTDKEHSGFYENVAFEIGGIIGLAVVGAALGIGATNGGGDDYCSPCCDHCFSGLFD